MRTFRPFVAWLLGWLVPGAGHFYIGRRAQGLVLGATLGGCFLAGALLGRGSAMDPQRPEYLVLQVGAGLPAAAAWLLRVDGPPSVDVGVRETAFLYTLVAAMLNVVAAVAAASLAAGAMPPDAREEESAAGDAPATPPAPADEAPATTDSPLPAPETGP